MRPNFSVASLYEANLKCSICCESFEVENTYVKMSDLIYLHCFVRISTQITLGKLHFFDSTGSCPFRVGFLLGCVPWLAVPENTSAPVFLQDRGHLVLRRSMRPISSVQKVDYGCDCQGSRTICGDRC